MIAAPRRNAIENTAGTNRIRTVFISDTHLGHECCRPEQLLRYLSEINPEQLYLVGDFIDGWALQKRWRWTPAVSRIFNRLSEMACQGCSINYVVGNHDAFLRTHPLIGEILLRANISIADEFEHVTVSGRRLLVIHGDRFDDYEKCSAIFEWITTRSGPKTITDWNTSCGLLAFERRPTWQRDPMGTRSRWPKRDLRRIRILS